MQHATEKAGLAAPSSGWATRSAKTHRDRYREGLAAAQLGGVSGGDESESLETPFVLRTLALVRASWLP
jgi:hypothetical protein